MSEKRGANYSAAEDKALCETWLNASCDPATGINQTGDDMYHKVRKVFEEILGTPTTRNPGSLKSRFQTISRSVSKFVGCFKQVERLDVSGRSPTDIIHQAVELYEAESGKFRFLQCWSILKDSPKWGAWRDGNAKKTSLRKRTAVECLAELQSVDGIGSSISDGTSTAETEVEDKRPIGQQRAKMERANLALYSSQVQATERMAKTADARVRVAQDQVDQNLLAWQQTLATRRRWSSSRSNDDLC